MVIVSVLYFFANSIACSAEFLEIPIPPKGVDAIHQEDIKRDIWAIEQGNSLDIWWKKRIAQLDGELIEQGEVSCLLHQGEKSRGFTYWTSSDGADVGIRLASLLSLAKTSDRLVLEQSYQYCLGKPKDLLEGEHQEIGNVAGKELLLVGNLWQTIEADDYHFEQLNFKQLEKNIKQIIHSNSSELIEASKP